MAIVVKILTACGLVLLFGSCSSNNGESTGPSGGTNSTGAGGAATGGGSNGTGLGGAATGGLTSTGVSGGALTTGGARPTGGAASTGGVFNTGGSTHSAGGAVGTGGRVTTGGISSTGTASTGGNFGAGGTSSTGGTSTSIGGNFAAGGTSSTGGKSTAGGTPSTGATLATGGVPATGGSSSTGAATGGSTSTCTPSSTYFSFFITSRTRLFALAQAFNGSTKGFGGDFRYGTADGLTGADKICTAIAEASMPGNCKVWRAFLSTSTVTAISRVGSGPWYDRLGRLVTANTAGLLGDRPTGANTTIINDLPNENGTPHEDEETSSSASDNHDILTGSTTKGTSYGATANCSDWTSSAASTSAKPRVGHSWSAGSGTNWISCLDESGCGPGYNLVQNGGPGFDGTVGSGGGYGAFYCLATTP